MSFDNNISNISKVDKCKHNAYSKSGIKPTEKFL